VPLVVHMKAVVDGVVLQVRDVSGHVYGCHNPGSLGPNHMGRAPRNRSGVVTTGRVHDPWTTFACWPC
jgi:hypothetical protein